MKLTPARLQVLHAAAAGTLVHSVYGGYDWIKGPGGATVTTATKAALRAGHIALQPRQQGDEHHGQAYKLTEDGEKALAAHNAKETAK